MSLDLTVRCIDRDKKAVKDALDLALNVFMECDAPLFNEEGKESFRAYIRSGTVERSLSSHKAHIVTANDKNRAVGVMAADEFRHIMIAFVDREYQHCGVGKALFHGLTMLMGDGVFTVNAAPPGYSFYKSLGFVPDEDEKDVNGLIFTPMTRK